MRRLLSLLGAAAALVALSGAAQHSARAGTAGSPTLVGAYHCIVADGGQATVPAGSTIVIRQGIGEQTLGIMRSFLNAQMTIASVSDGQMFDLGHAWSAPVQSGGFWLTAVEVPTGVTLAQPGDSMRFTFASLLTAKVPEIFNPAAGGQPGQPLPNGPGLAFGGTCTVTAT